MKLVYFYRNMGGIASYESGDALRLRQFILRNPQVEPIGVEMIEPDPSRMLSGEEVKEIIKNSA